MSYQPSRLAVRFANAALLILPFSCSSAPSSSSSTKAVLTHDQYQKAYAIISGVDYLPFEYTADGCYARALYMSMELAAEGIPSSSIYAFPQYNGDLKTADGTMWSFHVAPMVKDGPDADETVVDPSMKEGPYLTREKWIQDMEYDHAQIQTLLVQGSYYGYAAPFVPESVIDNFAALRPFQANDIVDACNVLYSYLGKAGLSDQDLSSRRGKLIERTKALTSTLQQRGKLTGGSILNGATCGGQSLLLP